MDWFLKNLLKVSVFLSLVSWVIGIVVLSIASSLPQALSGLFLILPSIVHIRNFFSIAVKSQSMSTVDRLSALFAGDDKVKH